MSNRTDVHSPANLVTEDYEFFAAIDHGGSDSQMEASAHKRVIVQAFMNLGYRFASVHGAGQCDHCGARLRYAAWMLHPKTMKVVEVGETCLENRFELATHEFHKLRKAAQLDRQAQRIKALVADFVVANPDLAFMADKTAESFPLTSRNNSFVLDVSRKLRNYGELSDRQIDAVRNAVQRDAERAVRQAEREAEQALAGPVPAGDKVDIEGTVVGRKFHETIYGSSYKLTVKLANGSCVWFTEPARIEVSVGDEIKCRLSTITASDDNESFGFGKRPTRFEITKSEED